MSDRSSENVLRMILGLSVCLLCLLVSVPASAQCTPAIVVESVVYQGETVGPNSQKVDQFTVRWGTSKICSLSGTANVVLKIKRITTEQTVSASDIDSSRTTGNGISLIIPRAATATDPRSWTVTITHTPSTASNRELRASGQGIPSLPTATIGPIPGGPILELQQTNQSLATLGVGNRRKVAVVAGNWQSIRNSVDSELFLVQAITCLAGAVNITGLSHTPASPTTQERVTIQYTATPPTCQKIKTFNLKSEFIRQDGTKQSPSVGVAGTVTTFSFALGNSASPIASYFIDLFGKFQAQSATPITVTKSGSF